MSDVGARTRLSVLAFVWLVATARAEGPPVELKPVDTGAGFSVALPATWTVGRPSGNVRFVAGNQTDDVAISVTDLGPTPEDSGAAEKIYRASFERSGFELVTTADFSVAGVTARRFVFAMKTATPEGHAEILLVPASGRTYAVMIATPAASFEARRHLILRIFESIAMK